MATETQFSDLLHSIERSTAPHEASMHLAEWMMRAGSKAMAVSVLENGELDTPFFFWAHDASDTGYSAHIKRRLDDGLDKELFAESRALGWSGRRTMYAIGSEIPDQYHSLRRTAQEAAGFGLPTGFLLRMPVAGGYMGVIALAGEARLLEFENEDWSWMLVTAAQAALKREVNILEELQSMLLSPNSAASMA